MVRLLLFLALLCLISGSVHAFQEADISSGFADARLKKSVSVNSYRMYIGELLDKLTAQSGVEMIASDSDGAARERVSVSFHDISIAEVMDSIKGLMSLKEAPYVWRREKRANSDEWSYRLIRSTAARRYPETLKAQIQKDFETDVLARVRWARLSPKERERTEEENPALRITPREAAGLSLMASLFDDDALIAIAQGKAARFPLAKTGAAGRAFLDSEGALHSPTPYPEIVSLTEPTEIGFERGKHTDSDLAPIFYITLERPGDGQQILGMKQFLSGAGGKPLEDAARNKIRDQWHNGATMPKEMTPSLTPKSRKNVKTPDDDPNPLFASLRQFADATGIPVFARVQQQSHFNADTKNLSPKQFLGTLKLAGVDYKWSGKTLLVTDYAWLNEAEDKKPAWAVIKELREHCKASSHQGLSLANYLESAERLTLAQLEEMYESVGWRFDYWADMKQVREWRPLLNALSRDATLKGKALSGVPISLAELPAPLRKAIADKTGGAARSIIITARMIKGVGEEGDAYVTTIAFLSAENAPLDKDEIYSAPWPPPRPKEPF